MKIKIVFIALLLSILLLGALAAMDIQAYLQSAPGIATLTGAAGEFHVQLTQMSVIETALATPGATP